MEVKINLIFLFQNSIPLGLSPSLLKAVFSSALQFYFYETTLEFLTRSNVRVYTNIN